MKRIITITISLLLAAATFAQGIPQTVNFSATVRDANNELLANTPVNVRLTFYENGEGGTPVYCALHQTTTNANGFMSFQLNRNVLAYACNGAPNTPFEEIPWENGNYWMQVEYQTQIGGEFLDLGYLELTSGFYAFTSNYALVAQKLEDFDIDVEDAQDGDVLVYNGSTHKWEARRPDNIGGGSSQYSIPTVTTLEANVTDMTITLNGNVTSDGGSTIINRGFVYGIEPDNLTQQVEGILIDSGTSEYTGTISLFDGFTTYYYRAYATNAFGTAYGDVKSFMTEGGSHISANWSEVIYLTRPSMTGYAHVGSTQVNQSENTIIGVKMVNNQTSTQAEAQATSNCEGFVVVDTDEFASVRDLYVAYTLGTKETSLMLPFDWHAKAYQQKIFISKVDNDYVLVKYISGDVCPNEWNGIYGNVYGFQYKARE